ncbi:hypothetical protein [Flavobacterium sp.]|jgi:hypothetical protein|uniref:hypothetical protein n=1 Tax=Flavobacterium sp. TaxID=239 RepID=UPI002A84050C|nr:hypothetical protein [Flavobacterium sp.]
MKAKFLFPNSFKKIGWFLFVPSVIITVLISVLHINSDEYLNVNVFAVYVDEILGKHHYFKLIKNSILDEILTISMILGGILICFSKLKVEDEMISKIRYESLVWATYLNYGLIILFTIFIYGTPYLSVLFHNMFTLLLFFIIRFHYMIYKLNKANQDDE